MQLTKTKLQQGVWEGILTGASAQQSPKIEVTHNTTVLSGVETQYNTKEEFWVLRIPIPTEAISDGVHTLLIRDTEADTQLGHVTLLAGDELHGDIRAEMDLMRAELDLLKRAFRRHCVETS